MQRLIVLLALSLWIAIWCVSCGGTGSDNNANSPTPSRSETIASTPTSSTSRTDSPNATSNGTTPSARCTDDRKPVITKPVKGGKVILTDLIRGMTPCPGMDHYIVVTPLEDGVNWVQNKPASVEADGSFNGEAQFGEGSNGIRKDFLVRILVTKAALAPGKLAHMPADVILSETVTVTREQ